MENQVEGHHDEMQPVAPVVGAIQKDEAPVLFAAAQWAWLRGERAKAPSAEEFGLAESQAGGLVRAIMNTDAYRELHRRHWNL